MAELRSLPGNPDAGRFACPWCGASFARRWIASDGVESLEEHWRRSPACSTNRGVNNPTQSKHDVRSGPVVLPDREDRDA